VSTRPAIGVIAPQLSGIYFGTLLSSLRAATAPHSDLLLAFQGTPRDLLASRIALDHVAGWVVLNTVDGLDQLARRFPVVTLGAQLPGVACPAVFPDNIGGMQAAVAHLLEHGHRRIAFVGNLANADIEQRHRGYLAALAAAGVEPDPRLLLRVEDNSEQSGATALARLVEAGVECTAIACATDENALGVLSAAHTFGRSVPGTLAVVGFDDIVLAHGAVPPLSTVRVSLQSLGAEAGRLLLDRIAGRETPAGAVHVPTSFIPRRSCGCLASSHSIGLSAVAAAADWRGALARQLVALAVAPHPVEPDADIGALWPGAGALAAALEDALDGRGEPASALAPAWLEAVQLTLSLETLLAMLKLLEETSAWLLAARGSSADAEARLAAFLDSARLELMRARIAPENAFVRSYSTLVQQNYSISIRLMRGAIDEARDLRWLRSVPFRWGCLGLWDGPPGPDGAPRLLIAGDHSNVAQPRPGGSVGARVVPEAFPPLDRMPAPVAPGELDLVVLLPIRTAERSWGVLALAGPIAYLSSSGNYDVLSAYAAQLSAALERDALETALRGAYEQANLLADTVRELSSPVIPLLPGVLLVPLIGTFDAQRSQLLIDQLLSRVAEHGAHVVLIDVTGVPLVDTQAAAALVQIANAARLLGARTVLVGVRPEIAQSMVALGIDLRQIETRASLAAALTTLQPAGGRAVGRGGLG
jgi:DNA-binding LacI/PurR family transcriptional regulator/anti-anti-sigma regulatory factor